MQHEGDDSSLVLLDDDGRDEIGSRQITRARNDTNLIRATTVHRYIGDAISSSARGDGIAGRRRYHDRIAASGSCLVIAETNLDDGPIRASAATRIAGERADEKRSDDQWTHIVNRP